MQVSRLEAQLKRVGEGAEKEKADMEAVLLNLSNALSGVDAQLKQSAVSRTASRICYPGAGCRLDLDGKRTSGWVGSN